jgi:serine/threonine protein kinase
MSGYDQAERPVRRLGPYELVRQLGRGGFAEVWLGKRTGPGGFESRVAIKTVRIELRTDPAFQQMFTDEAKLAARINHPNVVSIFELGEVDGVLYLVMEYITGRPLNVLGYMMQRAAKPIPVGIVMRILADTCAGLHAAHELERDGKSLGVIHRDVSPQNILVSDKGMVKLIDFGVAKANDRLAADTTDGHTKGKLRYMAPEQAMARAVDRRADIWAVGAVAFDLIEGHPPHDGQNDLARLFKLMDKSPPPSFVKDVPKPIADVIKKALEPDPDSRWATAAEMRTAIEAALDACNLRVTADTLAEFFGEALSAPSDDEDEEVQSDGAVLRHRLKRPSMREAMATIDVPPPESRSSLEHSLETQGELPIIETLSALNTRPHGVPRRASRVVMASVAAAALICVCALALGMRRDPASAVTPTAQATQTTPAPSSDLLAIPEPTANPGATPVAAPSPTPTNDDVAAAPAAPAVAPAAPAAAPGSAPALAFAVIERKKPAPPGAPAKTTRPRQTKPLLPAAPPSSRPRYDDTIQ